ncbi:MAG: phosphatidic acid phosphatase, partial [Bacteroidota bacterium]
MKKTTFLFLSLLLLASCEQVNPEFQEDAKDAALVHASMKKLTDVIVHDIFSPPVASRIYAYPSIAAYEVMINDHPEYKTLAGQLTDFEATPQPKEGVEYCYPLASLKA